MAERYDPLELLTQKHLAELWDLHPKTIQKWVADGTLPSVQLGRYRRVPRAAAEEFQRRHMNGAGPDDDATGE